MKLKSISKANDGKHKLVAEFETDGRTKHVKFGAVGYDDYTITKDKEQRDRYIHRHQKDLRTNDPSRPGFLARYILWNKPTISASTTDYKRRFNL